MGYECFTLSPRYLYARSPRPSYTPGKQPQFYSTASVRYHLDTQHRRSPPSARFRLVIINGVLALILPLGFDHQVLSDEQRVGLVFIIFCSFCSLLAILTTLALYIVRSPYLFLPWLYVLTHKMQQGVVRVRRSPSSTWVFLKTDIDAYFLSLLFADMLVASSGLFNLKWVMAGRTSCGVFCSAQGGLEQISLPAAGLSSLAIALHTFFVIFFRWTPPSTRVIGLCTLICIWTFLLSILLVVTPALTLSSSVSSLPFYTPTPVWCYIGAAHLALKAGAGYAFAWFAAVGSIVVYGLLFLRLRGALIRRREGRGTCGSFTVSVRWDLCWRFGSNAGDGSGDGNGELRGGTETDESAAMRSLSLREARKMLWYPLCYIIIILPLSASRWTSFIAHASGSSAKHDIPFGLTAATASVFKLGGLVDVLLFAFTRPNILFFGATREVNVMGGNAGRLGRLRSGRSAQSWLGGRTREREAGSDNGAGGDEGGFTTEMQRLEISDEGEESNATELVNRDGRSGGNAQARLISPASMSTNVSSSGGEPAHLASLDVLPRGRSQRRQQPVLDLANELDYYASPILPSVGSSAWASSSYGHSRRDRDTRFGRVPSFVPLTLDLPNSRISGMSGIIISAASSSGPSRLIRPSEGIASLVVDSRTFDDDTEQMHGGRDTEQILRNVTPDISKTSLDGVQESRNATAKECRSRETRGSSVGDAALLKVEIGHRTSPADVLIKTSIAAERPLDNLFLEGDPFSTSLPHSRPGSLSSHMHPRGPRPLPSRISPMSSATDFTRARPIRPTIGIPSSNFFTSSPSAMTSNNLSPSSSSRFSVRSPRLSYPQSALASIPEHRLLSHFPSSSLHSSSLSPTLPLSLHGSHPYSRPRSLSDGARHRPHGRIKEGAREGESGRRGEYFSFIDMK